MKIISIKSLALFSLVLIFSTSLSADNGNKLVYYILDSSGSMWGRVSGQPKVSIAKKTLSTLIDEMPNEVNAGLTTYGHRKKGDCSDIQEIISAGKIDRANSKKIISRLSPKGKTPITRSVKLVAEKVASYEDKANIVLISDGIETCDPKPCEAVKALKDSGAKFTMHVVGFGIKEADQEELSCLAKAGGGEYYRADSSTKLLKALKSVEKTVISEVKSPLKIVVEPAPKVQEQMVEEEKPELVERVAQEVKSKSKSKKIKILGPGKIKFKGHAFLEDPYKVKLVDPESGELKLSLSSLDEQLVATGDYLVSWHQTQHVTSPLELGELVTIESGKTTEVPLLTAIELKLPDWVKDPAYWSIRDLSSGLDLVKYENTKPQLALPGRYEIVWKQAEHTSSEVKLGEFEIGLDEINSPDLTTAIKLAPAEWLPKEVRSWGLLKPGTNDYVAFYKNNFKPQLVPAGTYNLAYQQTEHGSTNSILGPVVIKQGELNNVEINTGIGFSVAKDKKPPYRIHFLPLGSDGKPTGEISLKNSFGPMPLSPGKYRIDYHEKQHGTTRLTIVPELELEAGEFIEIEL